MILLLWVLLCGGALAADDLRLGVFVGNDLGAPGQERLLFATADAEKMRDLFVQHGGIAPRDAVLLLDQPRRSVSSALETAAGRVEQARAEGRSTTLVFYYSGHGDDQALHLGTSTIAHDELRQWLEDTGADVRIALLDACQSGSAVRQKGGTRGPSHAFAVDTSATRGTVFVTSSSASEFSQESEDLGGGFFTYYLHSALLGAGDQDRDGAVTLTEAYSYVYNETAFGTRHAPGTQTPLFDYDLSGSGEVQLTRLLASDAFLVFDGTLDGAYAVWDETRKRYVAEVDATRPSRIGLPAGTYFVHHRMPGWVDEAEYNLDAGDEMTVREVDFLTMAYEDTAARGDLKRQVRRATTPRLNLEAVLGVRTFGANSVFNQEYIPAHPVAGVQFRFLPHRKGPFWSVDLVTGSGSATLFFDLVGDQRVEVRSYSAGADAGWATGRSIVRAGGGGRVELVHFARDFQDVALDRQSSTSVAPGLAGWVGIHYGRFNIDYTQSLLVLPVRWDDNPSPLFSEMAFAVGYRF